MDKLIELSNLEMLESPIADIEQIKKKVSNDLKIYLDNLGICIVSCGDMWDYATQQILIDMQLAISKYKLRNDRELWI